MKKRLLPLILSLTVFYSQGQLVQWASKVIEFSSELTPIQYSASQALGKPNVLPAGGQNPNAWEPDKADRNEFLKLGFENPMQINQIAIAESFNPSALFRVLLYDEAGKEYEANVLNPRSIPLIGRMLNIFVDKTPYKVAAVKLEFDGAAVRNFYGIDAVAISNSEYPVIAFIPTPELLATGVVVESLGPEVNSNESEYKPILSPDGKTLYFSRKNHPGNVGGVNDEEDIWYSELGEDGMWKAAKNVGAPINNTYPNFINSITSTTPDGKSAIMLLGNQYLANGKMVAGVSVSNLVEGKWSDPVPLNIKNDYNLNEKANYLLSDNRETLLLSVQRYDTFGERDLYISFLGDDNIWTEPLNLGNVVNTASDESAPFLTDDDKTLYFSSDGFSGYGRTDIYVSKRLDDTWIKWSEPENLGPEINSVFDDLFFNIPNSSEYAYYSRGVSEKNVDIFRAKLPLYREPVFWVTVKGKLTDGTTGKPISAKIMTEKLSDGTPSGTVQSNPETGEYVIKLKAGQQYGVRVDPDDHLPAEKNLDLRDIAADKTMDNQDFVFQLSKFARITPNVIVTLNDIFLELNKATINKASYPELNKVVKYLDENPEMLLQVAGHTCDLGGDDYNMRLSKRRALEVQKYLVGKGIKKDRIHVNYFGEEYPAAENTSEENRKMNRRVEFKVVKP
ncbi:MAG: OmpA family protein [Cyclobacteriaceae bacterium]|nr:OmpA family protein [Cyclobacteriaceae bacterium]